MSDCEHEWHTYWMDRSTWDRCTKCNHYRTVEPVWSFDADKVGRELEALVEAIDVERPSETVDPWPMVTNEFGMEVLDNLWRGGYRLVRHDYGEERANRERTWLAARVDRYFSQRLEPDPRTIASDVLFILTLEDRPV